MQFNRNGVQVRQTQPVRSLKRVTRVVSIDSRDRDPTKFAKVNGNGTLVTTVTGGISTTTLTTTSTVTLNGGYILSGAGVIPGTTIVTTATGTSFVITPSQTVASGTVMQVINTAPTSDPGDYVVYFPRPFSNVTRIRLKNAMINAPTGGWTAYDQYIMLGLDGLNRIDETAPGADRAGYADYSFAKILNTNQITQTTTSASAIFYSDQSYDENTTAYNPPIGTLDRLRITFRRHLPYSGIGTTAPLNAPILFGTGENSLTFEIEYLDNVFEDVSSFETFLQADAGIPHASR